MREIEFRGKQTHTGEWHYGYLVYVPVDNGYKITQGKEISYFVNTDTIGQYSGQKDMNGTKIYEGDIHEFNGDLFVIRFGKFYDTVDRLDEYGWYCEGVNNDDVIGFDGTEDEYINIIGNIYDNPELLK
jgi:uncharacterized phage protein (TIGR01671 family)